MTDLGRLAELPQRELAGLVVREANTLRARGLGLAFMPTPPVGEALWIPRCSAIHTFGLRFSLELLWIDSDEHVVHVDRDVKPGRIRRCPAARSVIERAAGSGGTALGAD